MNRGFKKKRRLKKRVVLIFKLIIVFLLILFMQHSSFLKHLYTLFANKYVRNNYILKKDLLVNTNYLSSENKNSNSNNMFAVKEEKTSDPLIYLYNTHQTESYSSEGMLYKPTIIHATKYLKEKFEDGGFSTIVEGRSVSDILDKNNWLYGSSYRVSRMFMEDTVNSYPSIKYLFDIHRDAGTHSYTTLCIDTKCYAKLLFLIGLENPNYKENQIYAEELSKRINNKVNGLSKGILQKQGKNVNGVYNQDFSNRTILIEVGGENNTIEEVYNTLDVLYEVLSDYIKEEINYGI